MSFAVFLYPLLTAFGGDDSGWYYRIDVGECSQCELGRSVGMCPTSMVTAMGGLTLGKCVDKGKWMQLHARRTCVCVHLVRDRGGGWGGCALEVGVCCTEG